MARIKEKHFPFAGEVQPSGIKSSIKSLTAAPEKLLRQGEPARRDQDFRGRNYIRARELFKELEEQYGIKSLKGELVKGRNPETGDKVMFQLVDKLEGENFSELSELSPEQVAKVDEHYEKLFSYLWDKFKKQESYLWDIGRAEQVMLAKKPNSQEEPEVYVTDLDPMISHKSDLHLSVVYMCMRQAFEEMRQKVEPHISESPIQFAKARSKFLAILEEIASDPKLLRKVELRQESIVNLVQELKSSKV